MIVREGSARSTALTLDIEARPRAIERSRDRYIGCICSMLLAAYDLCSLLQNDLSLAAGIRCAPWFIPAPRP